MHQSQTTHCPSDDKFPRKTISKDADSIDWKNLRKFLDETKAKLDDFSHKVENKTEAKFNEIDESWQKLQSWLKQQTAKAHTMEDRAETIMDTARVKTHLAKMDAGDVVKDLAEQIEGIRSVIDRMLEKARLGSAETLSDLSASLNKLRCKLIAK